MLFFVSDPVWAQALSLSGGRSWGDQAKTYTWALAYEHAFSALWSGSLTWVNEGHIPNHRRDGPAFQAWARLPLSDSRLVLEAGAGPYFYFDTTTPAGAARYANEHGVGLLLSARASYALSSRWVAQLQFNRIQVARGPESTGVLFGVGYRLVPTRDDGLGEAVAVGASTRVSKVEVTAYAGQTILNSTHSPTSPALAFDVRFPLSRHFAWSVGYLHESVCEQARRDGVTTQWWLTQSFENDRFELGAAAGIYYALNEYEGAATQGPGSGTVSALISISAAYRFARQWTARATWNRVATHYDRDTDVIVAGLGFRF